MKKLEHERDLILMASQTLSTLGIMTGNLENFLSRQAAGSSFFQRQSVEKSKNENYVNNTMVRYQR